MNSINIILLATTIRFVYPWLLLLLIPAAFFSLFPYLRLKKQRRRTRNRVASLILHMIVMLMAVLVLSGMTFHNERVSVKNEVIVLVDASDSMQTLNTQVDVRVKEIVDECTDDYKIGIIEFANGYITTSKLDKNVDKVYNDYLDGNEKPNATATNIASALLYAREQFTRPEDGRIILLTDGLETDGSAISAATSISNTGTRIDTIFFTPATGNNEVKVNAINFANEVKKDRNVQIDVSVQSTKSSYATIKLYDNDVLKLTREEVPLSGGVDIVSLSYVFTDDSLHEVKVEVESTNDTLTQNNVGYAFVNINVPNKILLVDGSIGIKEASAVDSIQLKELVKNDFNIEVIGMDDVPTSVTGLQSFDEVILMNVSDAQLEDSGFDAVLWDFVSNYAGGLLTIGGDHAYEEMSGSLLESMLPVQTTDQLKPMSVMIVFDGSSSMNETVPGTGKTMYQIAKDGLAECVFTLKDSDYIGVIEYNANAYERIELTKASEKDTLIAAIENLTQNGTGTYYTRALEMARDALKPSKLTSVKHIMFITDGEPNDKDADPNDGKAGYFDLIRDDLSPGITVNVIGIGANGNNNDNLRTMAELGHGNYYSTNTGADLPAIMLEALSVASGKFINQTEATLQIEAFASQAVHGLVTLPNLSGFYGSVLTKQGATTVVSTTDGDPIYSEWVSGYTGGKVGSFMCDLNGTWSNAMLTTENGQKFIKNMIQSLMPTESTSTSDIALSFVNNNYTTQLNVNTVTGESDELEVQVTAPDGSKQKITMNRKTSKLQDGVFDTSKAGVYTVNVKKKDLFGDTISETVEYYAFSYSKEYSYFNNESVAYNYTKDIAMSGGGELITDTVGMFDLEAQVIKNDFDPRFVLLSLAMALFLLDIAARKFKFKWPKEIIASIKEKKEFEQKLAKK